MNDMSGRFEIAEALHTFEFGAGRLSPPRAFAEATARVEDALAELRAAEFALERQLSDLRSYMKATPASSARAA